MTAEDFLGKLLDWAIDLGAKIFAAVLVWIVGRMAIKWFVGRIRRSRFAEKNDRTVTVTLSHFVSAGLYVLLTVIVIGILGVPTASVIAAIASAGVAIGLALQGALGNIAGGIMILIMRPFRVGDYVEIADEAGTVTDVGIFYTQLTTPDHKIVTIPNGTVMGDTVVNLSMKETRRVDLTFGVAYGTDVSRVKMILLEEAARHDSVLADPAPFARLSNQNDSSLDFTLRVWVKNADYWQVRFDLLERMTVRFRDENIEIPYRKLDVHVRR